MIIRLDSKIKASLAALLIATVAFLALVVKINNERGEAQVRARQDLNQAQKYLSDIQAKSEAEAAKTKELLERQRKNNGNQEWDGYKIESPASTVALSRQYPNVARQPNQQRAYNSYQPVASRTPVPPQLSTAVWSTASNYCLYRTGGMSRQAAWNKAVLEAERIWKDELKFSKRINSLYGTLAREEIAEQCP